MVMAWLQVKEVDNGCHSIDGSGWCECSQVAGDPEQPGLLVLGCFLLHQIDTGLNACMGG